MAKRERGFSLLEMLVVLFVIGVLLMIALPNFRGAAERSQAKACYANQRLLFGQLEQYRLDKGTYPENLDLLVQEKYLQRVPRCPKDNAAYTVTVNGEEVTVTCPNHGEAKES
ncbi:competence type IV pilus major pilin ComGC [Calditerricola satsumensis]|uniref:ComG operon protein 3 n=1 Tax=Calditerricola satsumensis TaxID=373054 RepID=A0A8J3BFA4_9BACI|nr:prepilin-type N-terminal cleavage/methylation domain-containing protein [Calditerricola satsumensis]GGK04713.1 ComG operon protein 3 [Calditerricola satsumensis]